MSEKAMADLIALLERRLGRSWLDIVAWMREQHGLEEISRALTTHDFRGVLDAVEAGATRFATDLHAGFVEAGQQTARWIDDQVGAIVRFDVANPRAVAWAEQNELTLVRGLVQEQREVIHRVLVDGARSGANPLEIARDIRGSIGLTPSQVDAVASYRRALEQGDLANALDRELADGRYDRSLRSAMDGGRSLPQDQIDRMVDRYQQNYVTFRAETIARTESLRTTHQANEEAIRQAIANGDIEAGQVVREWHHSNVGKHPRPEHRAMDGQTRAWGELFTSGSGVRLAYPCDPAAPPSETVQCKCCLSTTLA